MHLNIPWPFYARIIWVIWYDDMIYIIFTSYEYEFASVARIKFNFTKSFQLLYTESKCWHGKRMKICVLSLEWVQNWISCAFVFLFFFKIISSIWSSFKFLSITNSKTNEMWLNLSKLLSLFKMLCPSVIIKLFFQIFKNICWSISVLPRKNRFYFPCGLVKLFHLCYVWHVSMMERSIHRIRFFSPHMMTSIFQANNQKDNRKTCRLRRIWNVCEH